jgi:hypothetical protein
LFDKRRCLCFFLSVPHLSAFSRAHPLTGSLAHVRALTRTIFTNALCAYQVEHKLRLVEYNLFPRLRYLLHSKRERTREVACVTLANAVHGGAALLPSMRDSGVLLSLLHNVGRPNATTRDAFVTWREAARTVYSVILCARSGGDETAGIAEYLVGNGVIKRMAETVSAATMFNIEHLLDPAFPLVRHILEAGDDRCRNAPARRRIAATNARDAAAAAAAGGSAAGGDAADSGGAAGAAASPEPKWKNSLAERLRILEEEGAGVCVCVYV